jgi:hypothetical protein
MSGYVIIIQNHMAQNQEKTINVRMEREQKDNKSVSMKLICEPSNITITNNFLCKA